MTTIPLSQSTAQYWAMYAKRVRSAVLAANQIVRLSERDLSIEAKSLNTGQWMPIQLAGGGTQFASAEDRLVVYEMITGMREIPEIKPVEAVT